MKAIHRIRSVVALFCLVTVVSVADAAAQPVCGLDRKVFATQERQVAAIRKLERKYNCQGRSGYGFFGVCRSLAHRLAKIQRQASSVRKQGARRDECVRTLKRGPADNSPKATTLANAALYCVRLSDGYFFPAPKSQFISRADIPAASDQCRFICNDAAMALYTRGIGSESEDMRALDSRARYADLPAAFRYQDDPAFKPCDHQRYYRRVALLRARSATVDTLRDLVVPRPTSRPHHEQVFADQEAVPPVSLEVTSSIQGTRIIDLSARPSLPIARPSGE
jgi:hypothetical protein